MWVNQLLWKFCMLKMLDLFLQRLNVYSILLLDTSDGPQDHNCLA
ncbi:hypothetical protein GLYMA_13G272250v4 [Glycine max]|nr:hypothetical protein GLYMA_13G272250v4 [Glycine max]KAH1103663.1 hypothetical protein GYH30_037536 [Glycine max]